MKNQRIAGSHLKPTLQSFVLADRIYIDALTGKKVICGTFNAMFSEKFPAKLGFAASAYLCLTNCRGRLKVYLYFVDLENESVLLRSPEIVFDSSSVHARHEVVMDVPPLPMPHAGVYAMDVYCNGEQIGNIRIDVSEKGRKES